MRQDHPGESHLAIGQATHGEILYHSADGERDLRKLSDAEMNVVRKRLQIVFQDPYSSLNPAFTIFGLCKTR